MKIIHTAVAAAVSMAAVCAGAPAEAKNHNAGAFIGGLVAGAVLGGAAAAAAQPPPYRYYGYPPPYPPPYYPPPPYAYPHYCGYAPYPPCYR